MKFKKKKLVLATISLASLIAIAKSEYRIHEEYHSVDLSKGSIDESIQIYEKKYGSNLESMKIKVLNNYFTKEAFEKLKEIPVVYGSTYSDSIAAATGRSFFANCFNLLDGYGWGRKTVVTSKEMSEGTCVHEYIHHASSVGLIDDKEFSVAWKLFCLDKDYEEIREHVDTKIISFYNPWIMNLFPYKTKIEREAILIEALYFPENWDQALIKKDLPDYMKKVYEKTLNFEKLKLE